MKTRTAITATLIALFFLLISCSPSPRPQSHRMLIITFPIGDKTVENFKKEMDSLGYGKERNITYILASAPEEGELRVKAQMLMGQKPGSVLSLTTWATRIGMELNSDGNLPHIFGQVSTLSGIGLDSDKDRAKHNMTGITAAVPVTKQLEYMKRLAPGAKRVLVVYKPDPLPLSMVMSLRNAAPSMKIDLIERNVGDLDDLVKMMQALKPGEVDALLQIPDSIATFNIPVFAQAALRLKVPLSVALEQNVSRKGALFSYVPDLEEHGKELATIADKILRGIPPSKLPVEIPKSYYLTINLETAREIGLTIPQDTLSRADRLVDGNELVP